MPRPQPASWDAQLRKWPGANLLQSWGWAEVQARAGWRVYRLQVPTAAGPLPVSAQVGDTVLPGLSRIYVPRGPVSPPDDLVAFGLVLEQLLALGRRTGARLLEIEVPWAAAELPPDHPWLAWSPAEPRQPRATLTVDLAPEPDAILASFHPKCRYNVRLAQRRGVLVDGAAGLAELAACVRATELRQRIHLPSQSHLAVVLEQLGEQARVFAARVGDTVVAAILVAIFGDQAIYLYGGATGRHRELMPNHLLHWQAMLWARGRGCRGYDLWGIPETDDPRHPWHGLAQFKRGFGGVEAHYAGARSKRLRLGGGVLLTLADAARRRARTRGRA
ncbi:MAG: lipid II:glycine glycyltransferase FemX [Candidatus Dormibacteria bacterium]